MIHFRNDYSVAAHPAVLEALARFNDERCPGYGRDPFCEEAAATIRKLCQAPDAAVHFLSGGTQVNKTALGAFLRPYEAAVAAESGHICGHETGSIEHNGHKILTCPAEDGKLTPAMLEAVCAGQTGEHAVVPRLAYISNTTEVGTVYTLAELRSLHDACTRLGLLLYCDGARLGAAITAPGSDAGFADYAALCDAFTIGGTKNGLLFGEALVITNSALQPYFRHCMKQQGATLAKGWVFGIQFSAILRDNLYLELAARANGLAGELTQGLQALGVPLLSASPSNQVFPLLPDGVVERLAEDFTFEIQQPSRDGHTGIRLVTGWYSSREDVDTFLQRLEVLLK